MEEKTMGPENKGGKTFGMAIQGGRSVPDIIPGIDKPFEPGRKKGKGIGKGVRNALIAATALTALGGAGYATYQEVPAIRRSVDRWLNGVPIEEKFPIKLEQSSFTPVTEEEERKLWENTKMVDLENHTFTIGIPFDKETIDRNPNIRTDQEFDAIPVPGTNIEELREKGVKNVTYYTGLSKGDRFRLIFDEERYKASVITSAIAGETQRGPVDTFTSAYTVVIVILQDRETGKNERFIIEGLYAKLLVENAPFPKGRGPSIEDGTLVGTRTSILELTTDLQDWDGKNEISNNERGQFVARSYFMQENPQAPIPLTLQHLKASNGDTATHKVLSDGAVNYGNGVIGPTPEDVRRANSGK